MAVFLLIFCHIFHGTCAFALNVVVCMLGLSSEFGGLEVFLFF